ncbi:tetratricopeptide repeat protein [Nonomuraea sp. NPDC049421]|uniref:tetratricopeptide repeat protein n=1 Tax=Nonomuraea sp. NPDC049421 TaxID=3155275 RepID=UPI0034218CB2
MEMDEEARKGLLAKVGPDHDYTFGSAVNLANDLAALGMHEKARELDEKNVEQVQAFYGDENLLSLAAAVNLSVDLRTVGEVAQSEELYADTMALYERLLPPDHPERLVAARSERFDWDFDPFSL